MIVGKVGEIFQSDDVGTLVVHDYKYNFLSELIYHGCNNS